MSDIVAKPRLLPFTPGKRKQVPPEEQTRPIWEVLVERAEQHPAEELDKIPHDAAENHDHYLYGVPRREGA